MDKSYKYFLALVCVIIFFKSALSQDALQRQFDYAKKLFNGENYYDSITEFKRLLFFDKDNKYGYMANEYIGEAYKMGAKFSDAIIYFAYAGMDASNTDEFFIAKINIIRANILRRTTSRALDLLDSLQKDKRFSLRLGEIYYWKGWSYIFADEWEKAAEAFTKTDTNQVLSKFCKKVHREKYSVPFAEIISHFIPGSGQFYTGHYLSGLLSLGWNVLWGYVTVNAFMANRVFDGLAVGNFLWLRFYNGNLQNSRKFAEEANLKITNKALNYLQFSYIGTKP